MKNLRTAAMREKYAAYLKDNPFHDCPLCSRTAIQTFTHWKVIPNHFPYDAIAQVHDMLVPVRHVSERELTKEEHDELLSIKENSLHMYHYFIEATPQYKSLPAHFHVHLIIAKPNIC